MNNSVEQRRYNLLYRQIEKKFFYVSNHKSKEILFLQIIELLNFNKKYIVKLIKDIQYQSQCNWGKIYSEFLCYYSNYILTKL
jgi:hypothetical protein